MPPLAAGIVPNPGLVPGAAGKPFDGAPGAFGPGNPAGTPLGLFGTSPQAPGPGESIVPVHDASIRLPTWKGRNARRSNTIRTSDMNMGSNS
jgi:hypothetical protein